MVSVGDAQDRPAGSTYFEEYLHAVSGAQEVHGLLGKELRAMGDIIRKRKNGRDLGWYIRWTENGKRRQRASHQPSYALAKKMLIEIEARVARGAAGIAEPSPGTELTFAELVEKFGAEFSNPRIKDRERYLLATRRVLSRVLSELGPLALKEVDQRHIARARDRVAQRYKPGSVRNTLIALSAVFSWAVRQGIVEKNPVRGVQRPPAPEPLIAYLSVGEVRAVLAEAEQRARTWRENLGLGWWSKWVAISLALRLGLRKGELFGLRWRDVDLETGQLRVARSYETSPKSGKTRHLRIPAGLVPLLREWRAICPRTPRELVCPLWIGGAWYMPTNPSATHGLPALLRKTGCRFVARPWHLLRHTMASHFVQSGGSLLALSKILGHSDIKVTMVYAHLSSDYLAAEVDRIKY